MSKKEEEKKEESLEVKGKETAVELKKTEDAIAHGLVAIERFGEIMLDDKRRQNATVGAGSVVGSVANLALDAREETDEEKREKLLEIGTTSVLEMSHGFASVIMAGARRRRARKNAGKVEGKVKVIEEEKK